SRRLGLDRRPRRARGRARRPPRGWPDPRDHLHRRGRSHRHRRRAHRRRRYLGIGTTIMQLGTRWDVGDPPPSSVPEDVHRAIQRVEAELEADGVDAAGWRWTLTWLERRPIVELDD